MEPDRERPGSLPQMQTGERPAGAGGASGSPGVDERTLYSTFLQGRNDPGVNEATLDKLMGERLGWSWAALLLGPAYFAYRKCYAGLAVVYAATAASFLIPIPNFIFWIGYGALFFPLYRLKARKAVAEAREEGATPESLARLSRKGGVNVILTVAMILAYATLLVAYLILGTMTRAQLRAIGLG